MAPLDPGQVQRLLPPTVSAAQARLVARQARGNPFWAREVAASLETAVTPVPPLARTLTDRLARSLTAEAREALAVVAAAGRISVAERAGGAGPLGIRPRHWIGGAGRRGRRDGGGSRPPTR